MNQEVKACGLSLVPSRRTGAASPRISCEVLALMNFMRLPLMKAAHVPVGWCRVQEIRVSSSFSRAVGFQCSFPLTRLIRCT
jgi:hypothetical protein